MQSEDSRTLYLSRLVAPLVFYRCLGVQEIVIDGQMREGEIRAKRSIKERVICALRCYKDVAALDIEISLRSTSCFEV